MTIWLWIGFAGLLLMLVALDLGVLSRRPRAVSAPEARASTALWLLAAAAAAWGVGLIYHHDLFGIEQTIGHPGGGWQAALQFLTAYATELALTLDNIVVLAAVFAFFRVPPELRARLLFWTVLCCLVLRLGMVLGGAWLMQDPRVSWLFGFLLVVSALRLATLPDEQADLSQRWLVRLVSRLPTRGQMQGQRLLVRGGEGRGWSLTPLAAVVFVAVAADLSFATDSIPAVFAVTRDPFIAFTSNALAILALRSLYFSVAPFMARLRYLKVAVSLVLLYLAVKMFTRHYALAPTWVTLAVVVSVTGAGVGLSVWHARRRAAKLLATPPGPTLSGAGPAPGPELALAHPGESPADAEAARPTPLEDLVEAAEVTRRNLRKILILIAGTFIVVVLAPLVGFLPGPGGIIVAGFGLALLATEFVWAKRLLDRLKQQGDRMQKGTGTLADRSPAWLAPVVVLGYWPVVWALTTFAPLPAWMVKPLWLGSIGGFLAVAYWAFLVARRVVRARRARIAGTPAGDGSAAQPGVGAAPGTPGTRHDASAA